MKTSKFLVLLVSASVLGACAGSNVSSSSAVPPSEWREEDLATMAELFSPLDTFVLPFPNGLTSSYVNNSADHVEQGDLSFSIIDHECGDLTSSYGAQLLESDFLYLADLVEESSKHTYYQYCMPDSLQSITVQIDYVNNESPYFGILASYGEKNGTYFDDSFPYGRIEKELGVSNASSAIPSFATLEEDGYRSYFNPAAESTEFVVQGTYSSSADEATLYNDYKADLVEYGYTVEDDAEYENSGYAKNASLGYGITFNAYKGSFIIFIEYSEPSKEEPGEAKDVSAGGTTALEGTKSLSLTADNFPNEYPSGKAEFALDPITFGYSSVMKSGTNIQFRSKDRGAGYLWNVTSLGSINSIEITATVNEYYGVLSLYLSNEEITSTDGLDYVTPTQTSTGYVYNIKGNYSHFHLVDEQSYASKNASIKINYTL